MFKKILVPLDGTQRAEKVLSYVEELALKFGSRLVLLHVVAPSFFYADRMALYVNVDVEIIDIDMQKAESYLGQLKKALVVQGIPVTIRIECGSTFDIICKVTQEEDVDLIAIATYGRTGWRRLLPGSIITQIQKRIAIPSLVVHTA